ncbi:MAG: hypothetical protein OEL20_05085 [Sulfuritalea sp.]|nr:hypothetical protein [Sulfuritalea sp.]
MKPHELLLALVVPGGFFLLALAYLARKQRHHFWRLGYLRNLLSIVVLGGPLGRIRIGTAFRALRDWPPAVTSARGAYVLDDALGV